MLCIVKIFVRLGITRKALAASISLHDNYVDSSGAL
jgi:hypothetical protein